MCDRQLDISWTRPDFFNIPDFLPGRLLADDFVFFKWCNSINPKRYTVVIQSLDTSSNCSFRSIGKLDKSLRLPFVQLGYGDDIKIGVIPDNPNLPRFVAKLIRGSTYEIPKVDKNGTYQMIRYGMDRPN